MEVKKIEEIIENKKDIPKDLIKYGGVYFLLKDKEIVYVGKSENIPNRLMNHLKDGLKDFDSYYSILVDNQDEMGAMEAYYITTIKTKYNAKIADRKYEKELLKILLKEKSGLDEIYFSVTLTEKQILHQERMADEFRSEQEYFKSLSDKSNRY